jgi:hypothetical protein
MRAKSTIRSAVLVLAAAGFAASPASAVCNPPKSVSTYNFLTGSYSYWHTSLPSPGITLVASIWSGTSDHTGTCNVSPGILYFGANPGDIGINLSLGDACVVGCPTGSLAIQATAFRGNRIETLLSKATETPGGGVNFDFSETGSHVLGLYPRIRVTASTQVGPNAYNINFTIDPPTAFEGAGSEVTAFNVLTADAPTDPGRLPSAYTLAATFPSTGGGGVSGSVVVQCNLNGYAVAQIVTAGGPSATVSETIRVCENRLADPKRNSRQMGTRTDQ